VPTMCQLKTGRKRNTRYDRVIEAQRQPADCHHQNGILRAEAAQHGVRSHGAQPRRYEHLALRIVQLGDASSQQGQRAGVPLSAVALEKI
jgi:hypothetical protein